MGIFKHKNPTTSQDSTLYEGVCSDGVTIHGGSDYWDITLGRQREPGRLFWGSETQKEVKHWRELSLNVREVWLE